MAVKLTKRKGFNFFRSYFDVYNELENDADKVAFMDALLERQFLGSKPENLKGMSRFAYISQTNSIDSQVKGYEDKMKIRLDGSIYVKDGVKESKTPLKEELNTPPDGGKNTPTEQEKEKEEVKEQVVIETSPQINTLTEELFLKRWCDARTYYDKLPTNIKKLTTFEKVDFKELAQDYELKDFEQAMQGMFQQKTYLKTRLRPSHFLKRDNFETYLTCFTTKEKLFEDKKYKKPVERI